MSCDCLNKVQQTRFKRSMLLWKPYIIDTKIECFLFRVYFSNKYNPVISINNEQQSHCNTTNTVNIRGREREKDSARVHQTEFH